MIILKVSTMKAFPLEATVRATSADARTRLGVSLLEVLFSLGVISVGLLGVATLIPLAATHVRQGSDAEQAAKVGMNALKQIELMGMTYLEDRDQNGAFSNTLSGAPQVDGSQAAGFETIWTHFDDNYVPAAQIGRFDSVCIDPRYVADNQTVVANTALSNVRFPHHLPASPLPAVLPRMWRVTLLDGVPRIPDGSGGFVKTLRWPAWPSGAPMSDLMAERLFVDHDRVHFTRPKDDTLPAEILYEPNNGIAKQQDGRQLSWFATLVPKLDAAGLLGSVSTLSAVVVQGRPSDLSVSDPLALEQERMAVVTNFFASGIGGGDVQLTSTSDANLEQVKRGNWIMLASTARLVQQPSGASRDIPQFAWYRVGSKTEIVDTSGTGVGPFTIDVTLAGPDWNRPEWVNAGHPNFRVTEAVIVEGAIGVFQRTIRRDVNAWK